MNVAPAENLIELPHFSLWDMIECGKQLRRAARDSTDFISTSQSLADYFYETLRDAEGRRAAALVRVFKTHRFGGLDDRLRAIACEALGQGSAISDDMKCLVLLATRGIEPAWNDRRRSTGHQAIPLQDAEALKRLPMIDGMVEQFGIRGDLPLLRSDSPTDAFLRRQFGVFHVPDALESEFVPSQDRFVIPHGIGSVLAFGGALPTGDIFSVVLFLRIQIESQVAELFQPLALSAKLALLDHPEPATLFDAAPVEDSGSGKRSQASLSVRDHVIEETLEVQENVVTAIASRLKDTTRRLQSLMDAATTVGIYATDLDGIVTDFNTGAEHLLGYSAKEVVGHRSPTLWHDRDELAAHVLAQPHDEKACVSAFDSLVSVARTGASDDREWMFVRKDASRIPVNLKTSAILGEDDTLRGFLWIATDISAQRESEREICKANDQLREQHDIAQYMASEAERANNAKSRFLANMSHELRTPLTAILGFSDWLLDGGALEDASDDVVSTMEAIHRNGTHLLGMIDDILELSRIDIGRLTLKRMRFSPKRMMNELDGILRPKAAEKRLAFSIGYTTQIPEFIDTDPVRLRKVLINLIDNAIKFTPVGEVRVKIARGGSPIEPTLRFEITDTGIGMSEAQKRAVIEPFVQADTSTTREFGGTGLGLAISQRLAEMLGGGICVESELGKGTRVTLAIPVAPRARATGNADDAHAEKADAVIAPDAAPLQAARVLLVEDGMDNQRLLALLLRNAGAEFDVASNGQEAITMALDALHRGAPFDVILMDMQMPVLDGYDATRALRDADYHLPIIALTANAMGGDRQRCIAAGCDEYLSKPIVKAALIEAVQRITATHSNASAATAP